MTGIDKQKDRFEILTDTIDSPIFTARNVREGGHFRPGKQRKLGGHDPNQGIIDHRSIGENEALIELDARSFAKNAIYAKKMIEHLNNFGIPYQAFYSGGKSVHLHIWLNFDVDIKHESNQKVIAEASKLGCNFYKKGRMKFIRDVLKNSELDADALLREGIVDKQKILWHENSSAPLIRVVGGRKMKVDDMGDIKTAFKTYLDIVPDKKPTGITHIDEVEFPPKPEKCDLDESFLVEIAKDYIDSIKGISARKELEHFDYEGNFLKLPCVLQAREGLESGKRGYGAKIIAIACRLDGLDKTQAAVVLTDYVTHCENPAEFSTQEALKWGDWMYKHREPYWSCGNCVKLGLCDKTDCPYHKGKFKEEMGFFKDNDPLKKVKEYLDILVEGEDSLKMGMFLLCMTKSMNPEWCIVVKGDAGSGKSHTIKAVLGLFGEDAKDYHTYSRFTGAALNHLGDFADNWNDTIVLIEEIQGARNAVEQLRVLISEGKLTLMEAVESQDDDGNKIHESKEKIVKLTNTLFITCDAEDEDADQMMSRAWILNTDTSTIQTKKVVAQKINDFSMVKKGIKYNHLREPIASALQSLEEYDDYEFPFKKELIDLRLFDNSGVRGRRDVVKLLRAAMAVARLYQHNRVWKDVDGKRILCVDWRDIEIVFRYLGETLNATAQGLGSTDMKYYEVININVVSYGRTPFTNAEVAQWCDVPYNTAKKLMIKFEKDGYFDLEGGDYHNKKKSYVKGTIEPKTYTSIRDIIEDKIKGQQTALEEWKAGVPAVPETNERQKVEDKADEQK